MKFVVDEGCELQRNAPPLLVVKIIKLVSKLSNGKLLTPGGIAANLGLQRGTITKATAHPLLKKYRFNRTHSEVFFGNPKTITALSKSYDAGN